MRNATLVRCKSIDLRKKHHTLWLCQQFAIEHGPFIADLPIEDGDFQ